MSAIDVSKFISTVSQAYNLLAGGRLDRHQVCKWIKYNKRNQRIVRQLLSQDCISIGEKQRYVCCLSQLETTGVKLSHLLKRGGHLRQPQQQRRSDRVQWRDLGSAFVSRIRTGVIINLGHLDTKSFFDDARMLFEPRIKNALKRESALKINATLSAEYLKRTSDGEDVMETKLFNTKNQALYQTTNLHSWFMENTTQPIMTEMEEFQERDSGWTLHTIVSLTININIYNPMRASSYIDLLQPIKLKKACINVQNSDNMCFKWAVLSALHPAENNPHRVSHYKPYENELNFDGMEFPMAPKNIKKFEKQNNISINLYMLRKPNKKNVFTVSPVHVTSLKKSTHVNLLLVEKTYTNEDEDDMRMSDDIIEDEASTQHHYVWVSDLSRLVSSQLSKSNRAKYICDRCLHYFISDEKLAAHEIDCKNINTCRVQLLSPKNNVLKFMNHKNKERVPFIIYADFECILKKPAQSNEPHKTKTEVCQVHEAFSVGYYFKCSYDDTLSYYRSYRGEKPAQWFVKELLQVAEDFETVFWCPIPMEPLSLKQETDFHTASVCHICDEPLLSEKRVRDHCHLTGKYRGPAHETCNILYQDSRTIPVVFHNLTGYDSHFIIKEIATCFEGRINVLPINLEKYISFTKHVKDSEISFRFIDSFRFLTSSLEKLSSYLTELKILEFEFRHLKAEQLTLLKRKGVFPYEFLDNWNKLDMVTKLPTKEKFHSLLTEYSDISQEDYEHATRVWTQFNIKSLGEYSDLYLKTDVLLLAEVFENFRTNCLKTYKLDPAHYYTTPGLTWDAMLKYTKVNLQLLTDVDMMLFVERGIRGGVSQCSNRYARANNRYMDDYNANEESTYLIYLDVNNLYGWAMTQYLPFGYFKWVDNNTHWNVSDESPIGYILEVDLEYPHELHDTHNDLPMCPEQRTPPGSKQAKLLTTLYQKTRYVLHYRNLKQAVEYGLKITKIHRILQFNQAPWLRSYIQLNTEMRQQAKNDFEKNLYKLMNNAVFGKTMENPRKRAQVKLVTKWEGRYGAEALISKPNFHSRAIFSENLVGVKLSLTEVLLNKPIYVGLSVLDLSKTCIYDFHYGFMKRKLNNDAKLIYTDTDSLIYQIKNQDIYQMIKRDICYFDTSDYPATNVFEMPQVNKKVVGLMKDECNGRIMTEFVALRSKMYSVRIEGEDKMKKAKGVKTAVVQNTINFDDYVDCLRNCISKERSQYLFRSRLHVVETIKQCKIALSPHDDKRRLLPDTTDTVSWGHYKYETE